MATIYKNYENISEILANGEEYKIMFAPSLNSYSIQCNKKFLRIDGLTFFKSLEALFDELLDLDVHIQLVANYMLNEIEYTMISKFSTLDELDFISAEYRI